MVSKSCRMKNFNRENLGGGKHLKTGRPVVGESEGSFLAR